MLKSSRLMVLGLLVLFTGMVGCSSAPVAIASTAPISSQAQADPVVVYDLQTEKKPGQQLTFHGLASEAAPTLKHLDGQVYQVQTPVKMTASSAKVIRTEWMEKGTWTKTVVSPSREVCKPPRTFTASVTGSYTIKVSATGDIAVVKASGEIGSTLTLSAGVTYSWTACAYFQKTETERYRRWELWAFYSDGTSKWSGGVSNTRLPGEKNDVVDNMVRAWSTR